MGTRNSISAVSTHSDTRPGPPRWAGTRIGSDILTLYFDPESVDKYIAMSEDSDSSKLFEILSHHAAPGARLLELGSGSGRDLIQLAETYAVTGSDFSDVFLARCRENHPHLPLLKLDARTIATHHLFDIIFSNKVLHHLSLDRLAVSLRRQAEILSPGGLVAHSFWIGKEAFEMDGMMFFYHDRFELVDFVSRFFDVLETHDYGELEEGDSLFLVARVC